MGSFPFSFFPSKLLRRRHRGQECRGINRALPHLRAILLPSCGPPAHQPLSCSLRTQGSFFLGWTLISCLKPSWIGEMSDYLTTTESIIVYVYHDSQPTSEDFRASRTSLFQPPPAPFLLYPLHVSSSGYLPAHKDSAGPSSLKQLYNPDMTLIFPALHTL